MANKLAVYICNGCGIAEAISPEKLCDIAVKEYHADICRIHPALCTGEGRNSVNTDLADGLYTVAVCACSPGVKQEWFEYDHCDVVERVNLREQVAWAHDPGDPDTQMMAEDGLRMGLAGAVKTARAAPYLPQVSRTILIIGGGIAGITAALGAAEAGYPACLVENSTSLGGWMAGLHRQYPKRPPYMEPEDTGIAELIATVENHPLVNVYKSAEVQRIDGSPGMFNISLSGPGGTVSLNAGAIVVATGFRPYDAARLGHLSYGMHPDIVTNVRMEQLASEGSIRRPSDGKIVQSAAFIQCAGQRDEGHLPYCSSFCCTTSIKQALYLTGNNPAARAYIFYKDIRTPSLYEEFYRNAQKAGSIYLSRTGPPAVSVADGGIHIEAEDLLTGGKVAVQVDMVVLAAGIVPSPPPVLNLMYRQGNELPELKYGYPDSHFICFPYETRRTGIYAAGCARQPQDSQSSEEDANGAVVKAIQCVEMVARGESTHPRAGDRSYPALYMARCTQCKRCTEECPFGTYDEDEKYNPLPNPTRCRRCGICMGACPERIISFADYSVDGIGSMIKSIEIPDADENKPRILAFLCENDAYPALDLACIQRMQFNPFVRIIPVRCLGSINMVWITDALSRGIDGIIMVGCKYGDDYQCHNITGSELTDTRIRKMQDALDKLALEPARLRVVQLSMEEYRRIPAIFDEFLDMIKEIGPNPYKDL